MKLIVVSTILEQGPRGARIKLIRDAEESMTNKRPIHSASGSTASIAVNICERNKWPYRLTMSGGRYIVERID